MRVLLINQYYYPDIAATAQLCSDLAADLVRHGHEVIALSGTASYRTPHTGHEALAKDSLGFSEVHEGVQILRVPVPENLPLMPELVGRALSYGTFLAGALYRAIRQTKPDVVLALSTPPLVAALGLCLKALKGVRFVYWVQDVYPDLAVKLGVMKQGGLPMRFFSALSRRLYGAADALVVLDEAMRDRLCEQGACRQRIHVIDNWSDPGEVTPQEPTDNRLRATCNLGSSFVVGYAGNMGRGHDFATVATALQHMAEDPIDWVFIGGGPQRAYLETQAQGLPRVRFLPPQARSGLRDALTLGDVGLITVDEGLSGLLVPSKLYGVLAAGRPIVYVGPKSGRIFDLVRDEELGVCIKNGDAYALASEVRRLAQSPALCKAMGERARAVFDKRFTRQKATSRHEEVLQLAVLSGRAV